MVQIRGQWGLLWMQREELIRGQVRIAEHAVRWTGREQDRRKTA
jgi:hypothetical protein